jgi:hypothetical protein
VTEPSASASPSPSASPGPAAADALVGQIIELAESDYAYGIGSLRLRVRQAAPMPDHPGWLSVEGVRIDNDGHDRETHSIGVRLDAALPYLAADRGPRARIPTQPEPTEN